MVFSLFAHFFIHSALSQGVNIDKVRVHFMRQSTGKIQQRWGRSLHRLEMLWTLLWTLLRVTVLEGENGIVS